MAARKIITQTTGDLTGDGIPEIIRLTGFQEPGSIAWQGIRLQIQDGASCLETRIALPEDAGYDPRLFVGSLTEAGSQDVLVSIASGGSGGLGYYAIYTFTDGAYKLIFDTESYNAAFPYIVTYLDHYVVRAESLMNRTVYLIDLADRDPAYLSQIYQSDGTLKAPVSGGVNPLSVLLPADFDGDGVYELLAYQRITGLYNADGLGDFINTLSWDGRVFGLFNQTVGIFGTEAK